MIAYEMTRRDKLLWTAAKLFLARGYSATSVDEIAEAAGTSGPALYRLFESKQDLLDQLCLAAIEQRRLGDREAIVSHSLDSHQTLRNLVRNRVAFAMGPWGYQVPITLAEYRHLSPAAAKALDSASQIGTAEWFRCLVQIRPETPTPVLLSIIYTVLMEITYAALRLDEAGAQGNVAPMLERLALAGLTGGR